MADRHFIPLRLGDLLSILLVKELRASPVKGLNNGSRLPDGGMCTDRPPEVSMGGVDTRKGSNLGSPVPEGCW